MGRPRKPTVMKVLNNTAQPCRLNEKEPITEPVTKMKAPSYLNGVAKKAFADLVKLVGADGMNVLAESDKVAMAMLCDQYSIYREARKEVRSEGLTFTSEGRAGTQIKARPEVAIMNAAWDRVGKMLTEFGCTPASRSKVDELESQGKDPFEEFLKQSS